MGCCSGDPGWGGQHLAPVLPASVQDLPVLEIQSQQQPGRFPALVSSSLVPVMFVFAHPFLPLSFLVERTGSLELQRVFNMYFSSDRLGPWQG